MQQDVLVVDDDEVIRQLLASILTDEGYRVRSAGDAYQAIEEVSQATPGLLLLDLMMPGVSGVELLTRLRRDQRWQELPVILISAHPRLHEIAQELGARAALTKPFNVSTLVSQVGQIFHPSLTNGAGLGTDGRANGAGLGTDGRPFTGRD
jgi:CheY-like chemotaxis protein